MDFRMKHYDFCNCNNISLPTVQKLFIDKRRQCILEFKYSKLHITENKLLREETNLKI